MVILIILTCTIIHYSLQSTKLKNLLSYRPTIISYSLLQYCTGPIRKAYKLAEDEKWILKNKIIYEQFR